MEKISNDSHLQDMKPASDKHPITTHLQNEPSKEPTRDGEKIGDSEAEDETGKLTVSKSVEGQSHLSSISIFKPGPSEENDREGGEVGDEGEGKEDGEDGHVLAAVVHRVHQHQLLRLPVGG